MVRRLLLIVVASALAAACGSTTSTPSPSAAAPLSAASAVPSAPPAASAATPGISAASSPAASADPASTAQAFIVALAQGEDTAAQALENSEMLAAAPADRLGMIWNQFVTQFGTYGSIGAITATAQGPYTIVTVHTIFASGTVALNVAIDASGKVAGLHVASAPAPASAAPSNSPVG